MKTNEIEITRNGSVISNHPDGVVCTYDGQHRNLKVLMEDGSTFELFQERIDSDTIRADYRTELMTIAHGEVCRDVQPHGQSDD